MRGAVAKWGNSLAVRLPKGVLDDTSLREGDSVDVSVENGRVVIAPVRPAVNLAELLDAYRPEHRHGEEWIDAPRGREVW
jgi:antitoxin MazE